jgi:HPt (histidine-containing phosphotransfer) domain-containing protein
VLDPAVVADLRRLRDGGAPDLLHHLLELLRADGPRLLAEMREAVANGDAAKLRSSAHSLKGSAANLGARPLADLCRDLEEIGRTGAVEGAGPLLVEAGEQLQWACEAFAAAAAEEG